MDGVVGKVVSAFPRLRGLPQDAWIGRHRVIVALLAAHVPALLAYGILRGSGSALHVALDVGVLAVLTWLAASSRLSIAARSIVASVGLVTASALTTHLAGGAIEAHFHFFVVLPIIGLYLDWRPFAVAVGYVVVHHAGFALLRPASVYPDALEPAEVIARTAVHAAFVVVEVAALLASWKLAETRQAALDQRNLELDRKNDMLDARNAELDGTVARLDAVVRAVHALAPKLRAAAAQVAATGDRVLQTATTTDGGAARSVGALGDVERAVGALRAAADNTAVGAEHVGERARETAAATRDGAHAVEHVRQAMADIRDCVSGIADGVVSLSKRTHRIGGIVATVRDLADQSKLLALNASIEAARAGEHGRGFAVVAEEVRALAERSAKATADVETLLGEIDAATRAAVGTAHRGTDVVDDGERRAARAGALLDEIARAGEEVEASARRIGEAAEAGRAGSTRIAAASDHAGTATGEVARSAQDARAAAEELRDLSAALEDLTTGLEAVAGTEQPLSLR